MTIVEGQDKGSHWSEEEEETDEEGQEEEEEEEKEKEEEEQEPQKKTGTGAVCRTGLAIGLCIELYQDVMC